MPQTETSSRLSLEQKIAVGRRKLQEAYDDRGCIDSVVLAASIKLDRLVTRCQQKMVKNTVPGFMPRKWRK
jgi:hypothetical protein